MIRSLLAVMLLSAALSFEARERAVQHPVTWQRPACSGIQGLASIRFLDPAGIVRQSYFHAINQYATIALGATPNTLYAIYDDRLYESTNAGCTWSLRTILPEGEVDFSIHATRDRIYAQSGLKLVRITGALVEVLDLPERVFGLAVDPASSLRLRAVSASGTFYESLDGGVSWTHVGAVPPSSLIDTVAFDPRDFDHVVIGLVLNRGGIGTGMTTRDGGRNWTPTPFPGSVLTYAMAFSPADPNVAWMIGFDVTGRETHLYRSNDGAVTFAPVHANDPKMNLLHRALAPHPRDPNVVAVRFFDHIGLVDDDGITFVTDTTVSDMVWSPAGTLYFTAPDESFDF
jgi:hypothetical protein